jgi:hypothetical protein
MDEETQNLNEFRLPLFPVNTPMVGRQVKLRDLFTLSGTVSVSSTTTTVSTDSHTTTETNLATFGFLPDEFHVGMAVRITAIGTYTSDGTRTVTVRVGNGTAPTTEWNSMASTAAITTNAPWHLQWTGIIATLGALGTLEAQMVGKINNVNKDDANTAAVAINTTTARTFAITAQWSATDAGNSITIRQLLIEILN